MQLSELHRFFLMTFAVATLLCAARATRGVVTCEEPPRFAYNDGNHYNGNDCHNDTLPIHTSLHK